jgi:regulator of protease activity HflC (stomatin/prohibitin superfamily)
MSGWGVVVLLVILVPLVAFAVWQFLQEALVRVPSGEVGLLVVRGKATDRVLEPGAHLVWPFRQQMIQGYPLRDLTYLTTASGHADDSDFVDSPLVARLGDRADVTIDYTIRFRILSDGLPSIHERVGPDGIKRLVRDVSRKVLVGELRLPEHQVVNTFGEARDQLEVALGEKMRSALAEHGFELEMFHVRHVDLGALTDVVVATIRAKMELELEAALAEVRTLRVQNEAATSELLQSSLSADVLRYRQIELARDALRRWDGRIVVNGTVSPTLSPEGVAASGATDDGAPSAHGES